MCAIFQFEQRITKQIKTHFVECNDKNADQIAKILCETLDKHNLKLSQVASYGAYNANVNFGSNHCFQESRCQKRKNIKC